jgi:NitT/TauT family transport system substrate-binding protein
MNTVYVSADGKFESAPDTALIQFNISAQENSPRAAYDRAAQETEQVRQIMRSNGVDPKSVTWVNVDANAKLSALKARSIDITTSFYNIHHIFQRELGDDMGFVAWRDVGLNPYGNSIVVNADYLAKHKAAIGKFVKVTQRAFAACVKDPKPCVQALVDANGALKFDNELTNWSLVEVLMSDKYSREVALGIHDDGRMKADYELVRDYVGIDKPFDVKSVYTNEFLDRSIRMTK